MKTNKPVHVWWSDLQNLSVCVYARVEKFVVFGGIFEKLLTAVKIFRKLLTVGKFLRKMKEIFFCMNYGMILKHKF